MKVAVLVLVILEQLLLWAGGAVGQMLHQDADVRSYEKNRLT